MNKILGYNIDTPDCVIKLKDDGSGFGINSSEYSSLDSFYTALSNDIQIADNVRIDGEINGTHYPCLLLCDSSGSNYELWYFSSISGYTKVPTGISNAKIIVYSFYTHTPK